MIDYPPLLEFKTKEEYKAYYKSELCVKAVHTNDEIRVYFPEQRFWHAFCSRDHLGRKNEFSFERAKYMNWIRPTLESPNATILKGYNKDTQNHEPHRRVTILYGDFVVILELSLKKDETLKANFITAFYAEKSIRKIKQAPEWNKQDCLEKLSKKNS